MIDHVLCLFNPITRRARAREREAKTWCSLWGALQEAGQPGCLVLLCLYFGAFAAVGGLNRVVDDRKLAWRAHPWPAWAVGRLRPLGRLGSYPSCGPVCDPTECVHVVVSSPTATQIWNTFLRGFISRFNTRTYLKINQALPGDVCIPHSRHWRPRGVRSKKPGSRDA